MIEAIAKAIEEAKAETDKPSIIIIEVKTIIGYGAEGQGIAVHGAPIVKTALITQKVFTVTMHQHLQFHEVARRFEAGIKFRGEAC